MTVNLKISLIVRKLFGRDNKTLGFYPANKNFWFSQPIFRYPNQILVASTKTETVIFMKESLYSRIIFKIALIDDLDSVITWEYV